jgi:hypothetical protein
MRRPAIGIIALLLLATAALLWGWGIEGQEMLMSACVRVGAVMAVLWLSYHEVSRLPGWIWAALPALLVVLAVRPKWLLVAIPIIVALVVLRPRRRA